MTTETTNGTTKQTTAEKNLAFWQQPSTTEASKVEASIPAKAAVTNKDGSVTPARAVELVYSGPADFAALWQCEDVAILRSYAFKGLRSAVNTAYATAVADGKAEANDKTAYEAVIREALTEPAVVRGFGIPTAPGATAVLKADLAEKNAAIAALQDAMASGDKAAIKDAMGRLSALKA